VTPKLAQRLHDHFHAGERAEAASPERPEPTARWPDADDPHVTMGGEVNRT
jgi:hypothetical protein